MILLKTEGSIASLPYFRVHDISKHMVVSLVYVP